MKKVLLTLVLVLVLCFTVGTFTSCDIPIDCEECGGNGQCHRCAGGGMTGWETCAICGGSGKCVPCGGDGSK